MNECGTILRSQLGCATWNAQATMRTGGESSRSPSRIELVATDQRRRSPALGRHGPANGELLAVALLEEEAGQTLHPGRVGRDGPRDPRFGS